MVYRIAVEPHGHRRVPWQQATRGGTAADRMVREIEVSTPPDLSRANPHLPPKLGLLLDEALVAIGDLEREHGPQLGPLAALLLRGESVASSKIEQIESGLDDYARALHGMRSNAAATSMAASTAALDDLITSVDDRSDIDLAAVLRAHRVLMRDDPFERSCAGRVRDVQNWIGGSDHSPRGALYVPPPAATLDQHLDNLLMLANRSDLNPLLQATMVHALFESIHPFMDGNGRIGRALINTVLRRRGATRRVVIPLASALVARCDDYFDRLGAFRTGDLAPLVESFAVGVRIAAQESATSADHLARLPDSWHEHAGRPRQGSATQRLLDRLLDTPIFNADDAQRSVGGATSSIYAAIDRLASAGIVRPLTGRQRNQVWIASDVAAELEDLGARIAHRARTVDLAT